MKITHRQLRRIIKEAISSDDPMTRINQILEDSIPEIEAIAYRSVIAHDPTRYVGEQPGFRSRSLTYTFMSTWGGHDDRLWNASTTRARQVVMEALLSAGAFIPGPVPVMDDFGTPGVKFVLDGQKFILITTGYRYDVEIYVTKEKQ